jgi:two-component system, NarL family, invasion response regulator UvrY
MGSSPTQSREGERFLRSASAVARCAGTSRVVTAVGRVADVNRATAETGPRTGRPVLVVDDEPEVVLTIDRLLRRSWPLVVADSWNQAHSVIEAAPALSCAIVDIGLPDGSGLDLLSPLREAYTLLPVLVLTAHCEAALINKAQAFGVEYLVKPDFADGLRAFAARVAANEALRGSGEYRQDVADAVHAFATTYDLTTRERDVLELAVGEHSRTEIAERLGISIHTIKAQVASILAKCSQTSLVVVARRLRQPDRT